MAHEHMLFVLVVAHFLCDFPLQGDFLAKAKNPEAPLPGVPWQWAMLAHAAIHAGAVLAITGNLQMACMELCAHAAIDIEKCRGKLTFGGDQALHLACKLLYVLLVMWRA